MNSTTGVVIDVGYESTTVSPVSDSTVYANGVVEVPLGIRHCEAYMAKLLADVPSVIEALTSPLPAPEVEASTSTAEGAAAPPPPSYPDTPLPETLLRLAKQLWKSNTIRPLLMGGQMLTVEEEEGVNDIAAALAAGKERALIEAKAANAKSHKSAARQAEDAKKKAAAAAADGAAADADVVLVEFEGREFYLGRVRNKFCEPLFEPTLLAGLEGLEGLEKPSEMVAVQEAVQSSIGTVFGREKLALWEGVVVVGELARIKSESRSPFRPSLFFSSFVESSSAYSLSFSFCVLQHYPPLSSPISCPTSSPIPIPRQTPNPRTLDSFESPNTSPSTSTREDGSLLSWELLLSERSVLLPLSIFSSLRDASLSPLFSLSTSTSLTLFPLVLDLSSSSTPTQQVDS